MISSDSSRPKKCRVCRNDFVPFQSLQIVCGVKCARRVPIVERKRDRERLNQLKPRGHWLAQAQTAFNAWIRERDVALPCISCQRHHKGKWNAGHYLSTGARPELRFDEMNVHKQCEPCNTSLSGNLILYRANLIARIGLEEVENLEGPHLPLHLGIDELKAITADYRARLKAMKGARA